MYKLMPEEKQLFIEICKSEFFLLEGTYRPGSNPLENDLRALCQLKSGAGCNGPEKILEKLEVTGKILSTIHDVIVISPDKCLRIKAIIENSKSSFELHRNSVWDTVYNIISVLIPPVGIITGLVKMRVQLAQFTFQNTFKPLFRKGCIASL